MSVCGLKHLAYVALRGDLCWRQQQEQRVLLAGSTATASLSSYLFVHTQTQAQAQAQAQAQTQTQTQTQTQAQTQAQTHQEAFITKEPKLLIQVQCPRVTMKSQKSVSVESK